MLFGPNAATGSVDAPSASALGDVRRQAIPTGGYDPEDDLSFAARESGVPVEHLRGHAGTESAGGRNMVNPRSSASGPLQVIRGTFDELNQNDFGGALDWNSNRDKARAGARYYRQQLDKYGGDRATALGAYFVGPAKADELLRSGGKEGLMGYSVPGQGRPITVGEYVSKTMGSYEERGSSGQQGAIPERVDLNAPLPGRGDAPKSLRGILYGDGPIETPKPEGEAGWADFGRAAAITAGDFVKAPVAALENLAGQLSGEGRNATEKSLADSQDSLGGVRRSIGEWQKGFFDSMSPEAIDFAQREYTQLSGDKSMWQGGVGDFMKATALKGTLSLGPTIGPMITTAILTRLGAGASASTLFGAQEGLMSAGLTAAQIADNLEQTPLVELQKVARFRELESQLGEAEARRQYLNEVQGVVPAITGLLVGSIAKGVGKPLDKIFGTGAGLPFTGRVATGATVEALQEGPQSFVEQVMQNYAEMAYNSNINLLDGAAEQVVQGMLLGGVMGGTFAGMFGNRPQKRALSSDPVPADIRAAMGQTKAAQAEAIPTGAPPADGGGGPPAPGPAPSTTPTLDAFAQQEPAPTEQPKQELFGDNVLAPEVAIPEVAPTNAPFPKNKAKAPKLEWTDGVPDAVDKFGAQQDAEAAARGIQLTPEGFQNPVPTDIEAALGAVERQPFDPNATGPQPEQVIADQPEQRPSFEVNQTREPKYGQRTRTEMLGYRVRVLNEDGSVASSQLVDGKATAKILAKQAEKKLQPGQTIQMVPARRSFQNDKTPTAEPISDLMAQINDMQSRDPLDMRMDSDARRGVYITRESLNNLREAGLLDKALSGGVPIKNFDTYGGVMLAKDEETAQELMQFIEDPNSNIDEVIGYATGAGNGKPGGTNPVVQLLDNDGNVIRERQVQPEEVEATKAKWGPMSRALSLEKALAFRQSRMEREKSERAAIAQQQAFSATNPEGQVAEIFNENQITAPLAGEAEALAKKGGLEEDIGGRLIELAKDTRAAERGRRTIDPRIPAPEDVKFRGREVVQRSQEETRLRRAGKTAEADSIRSSLAGQSKARDDLSAAYKELNDKLLTAALKLQLAETAQGVTEAQREYDQIIEELRAFYDVEGGYTKAEAVAKAASRYSPKARKKALEAAAKARETKQAEADKKEEDSLEVVRMARAERQSKGIKDERIRSRGDEPREEKKLKRIAQAAEVSVERMASDLQRAKKRFLTPEGKRLVENLFMILSPTVAQDLDQLIGPQGDEKTRTATATALLESHQLLRQWLSDYRQSLLFQTTVGKEQRELNGLLAARAGEVAEMLGNLRAYHQGDISIADDAARYLAYRISTFVTHGKRWGVATEMNIDGFWDAMAKGPMAFRDYLQDTVQAREDIPFPANLTEENLKGVSLGTLNALYVKSLEFLDGSRSSDGQRMAIVAAIKNAATERGLKLSDQPEIVEVEVWDQRKHEYVTLKRAISPRMLFAETFRRSYGVRGADSRMSMQQLKDLYLNGATLKVWENGWVTMEDTSSPLKRNWKLKEGSFKGKGKPQIIKLPPLGTSLPEALPLNVQARRVPPEKKRRSILRASRAMERKQYGGKSQSTGLTRTAKSDDPRSRADTKYNTDVLLDDVAPRELGKRATEYEEQKAASASALSDALSNMEKFLALADTAKFKKAAGGEQNVLHARAYARWLYEYGTSLSMAKLKSWNAFREMSRVADDINALAELTPEKFVETVESKFRAEMNEQLFQAVSLDPVNLKNLRDPKKRAKLLAESHDRLRKIVVFHKRLTEKWGKHPLFLQDIQPVLNRISESIAVRHRGQFQVRGGWSTAQFTDAERAAVKQHMDDWKAARDLPLMQRGKLFQQWGVPASELYNDFYLPLNEMLTDAGFFDPDQALLKVYDRRFDKYDDQSTGPVDVILTDEAGMPIQRRFASVGEVDPVARAAMDLEARNREAVDRQLLELDDGDLIDATIVDMGEVRPITAADKERRRKMISSPIGKTAASARKLLEANDIIVQFHKVLYSPDSNVRQVAMAESRMLANLRELGLVADGAQPETYTIGIPDGADVMAKLEEELADLQEAQAKVDSLRDAEDAETFATRSLSDSKPMKEVARLAGEIQQTRDAITAVREMQLGNKRAGRIAYTSVGQRLVKGEITKEAARLEAGSKLTGFQIKTAKAERLGEERAKTRGDKLKERAKAAAEEKKRREGMSYEQRKAAESYDRLGYGDLKFDISTQEADYGRASAGEYEAFLGLRDRLAQNPSTLGETLAFISDQLGPGHKYQPLIRLLNKHAAHRAVPVRFSFDLEPNENGSLVLQNGSPVILLNEDSFTTTGFNPLRALHVVMHESVHAATVQAMVNNQPATDALDMIRRVAAEQLGDKHKYATSNVFEFVAEAYTNAEFQRALKGIKIEAVKNGSVWNQFVTWVRNLLGFDPQFDNLLDAVMSLQESTFGPDPYDKTGSRKMKKWAGDSKLNLRDEFASTIANSAIMQHRVAQDAMQTASSLGNNIKEGGQSFLLKALSMRQLAQFYGRYFGKVGTVNPFNKYMNAFEERNSYASQLLEEADKLSRRWTAVEEGKKEQGVELSRLMHDATVQGVHADKPGSALYARYQALSPEAQQLYKDVRDYYTATQKREVQLMLANALRASKLWKGGEINAEEIDLEGITKGDWLQQKLGLDLKAMKAQLTADAKGMDAKAYKAREADYENTVEELKLIARMANIPTTNDGPYFPLMRFGDYAVKAEKVVATETYATRAERSEAMDEWLEKDPTLQFNFPQTEDGSFQLTVKQVEFRLAESHAEAAAAREDLVADYGDENVTKVQLKRNLINDGATIDSNRALQTLLGKLDGNAAAQAALREFYIKSLSDRSFRKREAKRKNIRGADPTKQHRTFGAYSKSASYYTSQLKYGHVMADAKAEMEKVVEAHRDESQISAVRMGQIVNEIKIRDKQAASLTDVSPIVRGAVETGQLWLLLSPSYWMLNATQPWMVTTPWLAARSSMPTAIKALAEAQALIIDPLVTQGVKSWGGLKAVRSRLAAEQAFNVLDNVEATIRTKLGADAQPVLDMLTALKRESIIDLSFVAELRDVAEGQDKGPWGKVMDASRVLAHLTEVNNRIMTAIASYNVAKAQPAAGRTAEQIEKDATDFAKRAVAETQFDYSAANKPRLFSANDAWWKPLVFQFMQYVQHMYVLFVRHASMWWSAPRGSQEAKIGRRVVLGLLASHMVTGGILGATPQLAKWAIGLAMMAFGAGDDDDSSFKNWASGEYYNRMMTDAVSWLAGNGKVGEALRAGAPRLAGFDLSSRTAFLQTYMIDIDAKSSETLYGSLVTSFGGPMFGIAGNAFEAAQLALEGDADKAWEKLLPKIGRDAVRAARFWNEGMVDHTGKTIVRADDLDPWELFLTAMGFQTSQVAETYARNNRARGAEAFVASRKAEISAAYRKARSTGEINAVMADLREFNKQFPRDRITMSQLIRGLRDQRKAEQNIRRYGVDAGRRSNEYDSDSYNVE